MRSPHIAAIMASVALAPVPAIAQKMPRESNREYRGNALLHGRSNILGTLRGAADGAALGCGNVRCR